ncbi:putative mRNA Cleavage and polyadenylation specificity factor (plasmid) [Legionella adelaidensis]|uniref:Metallo-beta-lactamase superfamily protein n=1 Tax=Legionella adelaidensis TaxID=45056 RepID=A0A0W0R481_9GAMM|nr:MBL fold metallo-hydrolase [Legionella adelaidensis]KTC65836.1 metallo-beta-lactamase superfamily protein [Legionella adelaidensis]VEH85266.1 putative mRNA Cleavage and polyadenylation specificity factor [Legionella adelaidensis]
MQLGDWLITKKQGLYCIPGDFYIDPSSPVSTAIISHAHSDHACAGHEKVFATPATISIMKIRFGDGCAKDYFEVSYNQQTQLNGVSLTFIPSGHILGSAQIVMEYANQKIIFSGDYKRAIDPTCEPFNVCSCDVFITEATFGLPVFQHPAIEDELTKLLSSLHIFNNFCHLLAVYPIGKCQRIIKTLRLMDYQHTLYLHPSLEKYCNYYQSIGVDLGSLQKIESLKDMQGKIVFCPPSALQS